MTATDELAVRPPGLYQRLEPPWSGLEVVRYAVVDFETTGLEPESDRILECAVLEVSASGEVLSEWSSLVAAPGEGEPDAGTIHGITRTMLEAAPSFSELRGELLRRLRGHVLVGHVLSFDVACLGAEFARLGLALPFLGEIGVCTRELCRQAFASDSYSLAACCAATGVVLRAPHTALGDARATAGLLAHFIRRATPLTPPSLVRAALSAPWPHAPFGPPSGRRRSALG